MKKILIADASKASLVMTSEVFKDHFPGVQVLVARTSAEALEVAKREDQIDAFVVDFDLPDKDGAYTAAKMKKLFPIPVLITAFDRPDVQETIERLCSAHDDCLSWLAKPVNAELVVSIAQRFIEGNFRTQRRIECMLPAIAEVTIKQRGKKNKQAGAEDGASGTKVCLPIMLEDCSVGGFKFRMMQRDIEALPAFHFSPEGRLNIDEIVTVMLPSFDAIQTGEENVGYWLWDENRGGPTKTASPKSAAHSPRNTLSNIKRTSRQALGDKSHEIQPLRGKAIWTTRVDGGDALVGIRSDNMVLSKKLFESVLLGDNKIQARKARLEVHRERMKEREVQIPGGMPARRPLEVITGSFNKSMGPAQHSAANETKPPVAPQTSPTPSAPPAPSLVALPGGKSEARTPPKALKKALAEQKKPPVPANKPAMVAKQAAVTAKKTAVVAKKPAVVAKKPTVVAKKPAVAAKKKPAPAAKKTLVAPKKKTTAPAKKSVVAAKKKTAGAAKGKPVAAAKSAASKKSKAAAKGKRRAS
jgi:CheY-like chemotaxis protein